MPTVLSRHGLGGPASTPSAWPAPLLLVDSERPPCRVPGPRLGAGAWRGDAAGFDGREVKVNQRGVRDDSDSVPPSPRRRNSAVQGAMCREPRAQVTPVRVASGAPPHQPRVVGGKLLLPRVRRMGVKARVSPQWKFEG